MNLLYRDSEVAVVCKGTGETSESVLQAFNKSRSRPAHPIHRLDQPVTGILVVAFNPRTAAALARRMDEGLFERTYIAICQRGPGVEPGTWEDTLLFDKRARRGRVVNGETGGDTRIARLRADRIGATDRYDVWRFRLETGRRHQIRVQCAQRGVPVVGDLKYGARRSRRGGGIYLHAVSVGFPHPTTGQPLTVWAYPPREPLWEAAWRLFDGVPVD